MKELKIGRITLGMCQTNFYFLYKEGDSRVIAVDPADKGQYLYDVLSQHGFRVEAILLTHGHFDHIWGVNELRRLSNAKVYAYEEEEELLNSDRLNVSKGAGRPYTVEADHLFRDNETFSICDMEGKVISTPGHTKGSCCFYFEKDGILLSGDTLFCESVGRTDLPTGSGSAIVRSIKERLLCLPDETKVYPGHGDMTTIGHEKMYNPFLG